MSSASLHDRGSAVFKSGLLTLLAVLVGGVTSLVAIAPPHPCLLRCKDKHMLDMRQMSDDLSEWSLDFISPIQSMLDRDRSMVYVERRMRQMCRYNAHYAKCLNGCPESVSQQILHAGLEPWIFLCSSFVTDGAILRIIPCWSKHGRRMQSSCAKDRTDLSLILQTLASPGNDRRDKFRKMCTAMQQYDLCFLTENEKYCGPTATRFMLQLNNVTGHSLAKMLRYAGNWAQHRLPSACWHWFNPGDYVAANRERLLGIRAAAAASGPALARNAERLLANWLLPAGVLIGCRWIRW